MSISRAVSDPTQCSRCGRPIGARAWEVIDLQERPDLRATLADADWGTVQCSECGHSQARRLALVVVGLSPEAPIVLGVENERFALDDPMAPSQNLVEETYRALGDRTLELPGPVVAAPFDVLSVAAGRDVADDVLASTTPLPERYAIFVAILRESRPQRRINLARNRLLNVSAVDDLRAAIAEMPEIVGTTVLASLVDELAHAATDEERPIAQARVDLVRTAAAGRVDEAWAGYERALVLLHESHFAPRVDELMGQLRAAESGNASRAMSIGDELLDFLQHGGGRSGFHVEGLLRTASAYYNSSGPGVEHRLDRVIELCQRAVRIIDEGVDDLEDHKAMPQERVRALLNEGAAFARRRRGDPAANLARASELQRAVLRKVSLESDPRVWAMASTNLGMNLVHRAAYRGENDPTREAEIREALDHFQNSLQWRAFERDPLDWAFTQMGLGLAYGYRRQADRSSDVRLAIEHHRASAQGMLAAGEPGLEAQAQHNVASEAVVLAQLPGTTDGHRSQLLDEATRACRRSLALRPPEIDPVGAAATQGVLARALELTGDTRTAIDVRRDTLQRLEPDIAPHAARREARDLAELAIRLDDWDEAARAYEVAAQATVSALEGRADSAGRFEELGHAENVFRWAAEALIRAGRLRRAVEVLELGRARELAAWLQRDTSLAELRELDPALHDRLLDLRQQLDRHEQARRDDQPADLAAAAETQEAYRRVVAAIRALPGFERFLLPPQYVDIASTIPEGDAIVYLFSAPGGTYAVVATHAGEPEIVEARELTSTRVVQRLIRSGERPGELAGYLPAQAANTEDLDDAISELSDLLGAPLLRPLAEIIERTGARTTCVVAAGLLGLVPLHALAWEDGSEETCLLEHSEVIVAPSAFARQVCQRRALERATPGHLLAVGNPLPHPKPLPWSAEEAQMVADTLPSSGATLLTETQATKDAVAQALPDASFIHLACHGSAALSAQALDSALYFAHDERLTGADLLGLAPLPARLIVASACETAIIPGYETVDEALSLSTVLLGAGAAGAVASLWAVNDFATALLMSRFYEELASGVTPASALRVAMLWLRDLSLDSAVTYAKGRPALRAQVDRAGTVAGGDDRVDRPFRAPSLWAAFVLSGA